MKYCTSCAHCAVNDQYCFAKDTDLGYGYMRNPNNCKSYRRRDENETEEEL